MPPPSPPPAFPPPKIFAPASAALLILLFVVYTTSLLYIVMLSSTRPFPRSLLCPTRLSITRNLFHQRKQRSNHNNHKPKTETSQNTTSTLTSPYSPSASAKFSSCSSSSTQLPSAVNSTNLPSYSQLPLNFARANTNFLGQDTNFKQSINMAPASMMTPFLRSGTPSQRYIFHPLPFVSVLGSIASLVESFLANNCVCYSGEHQASSAVHSAAHSRSHSPTDFDTSYNEDLRAQLKVHGLLPPHVESYELQKARCKLSPLPTLMLYDYHARNLRIILPGFEFQPQCGLSPLCSNIPNSRHFAEYCMITLSVLTVVCVLGLEQIAQKSNPIDKYMYLSNLRNTNVNLFYRLLMDNMRVSVSLFDFPLLLFPG